MAKAYQAGYGGSVTATGTPGWTADVGNWRLRWAAELHETTVISDAGVRRTAGMEDWTITCEVFIDIGTPDDWDAEGFGVGDALTDIVLTATGAIAWTGSAGIIESNDMTYEPRGVYRGTLVIQGNGTMTHAVA